MCFKTLLRFAAASLISTLLFNGCSSESATEDRTGQSEEVSQESLAPRPARNILLITLDTLRADYLSSYGSEKASTPHLDALAERGVRFENAIVQVPLTLPSHASILTGTYPQIHGVRDIGGFVLADGVPTIASILREAEYETAAFLGAAVLNRRFQLNRGFDHYNDTMEEQLGDEEQKLPGVVAEVRARTVTNRAIEWLTEWRSGTEGGEHFLLWAHYYDPHRPFDAPEPFKSKYADDAYAGEVAYTDAEVGRLLQELEELNLVDETLIIVIADHGESLGDHGEYTHGVFLYDATMRVPLIVAGPEIASGVEIDQQVRSIDVLPTVAEYLGLSSGDKVQGTSLLPALTEARGVRTTYAYMETLYPKTHMGWAELRGVRTDEWKLIVAPRPELYRIDQDPQETTNVVDRFPVEADRLQKQIWEVAGPPESLGELDYQPLDPQTQEELASLGYVSAGVRRNLKIDMSGPDPKDRIHELQILEDAGELMNAGRFADAIPLLANLVEEGSTNPLVFQHLALCHNRQGEYRKALQVYETAVERGSDTDETHAEMGELYIRFGDLRPATEAMEESARRNPTNLQNLTNLATAYLQMGEFSEARRAIRAIQAQDENSAQAFNLLGILEVQQGNDSVARGYFEKAVQFEPEMAEPYMNLGIIAQEAGQREQAISYFKRFLERAGSDNIELQARVRSVIARLEAGL